jgi:hypothetical protein
MKSIEKHTVLPLAPRGYEAAGPCEKTETVKELLRSPQPPQVLQNSPSLVATKTKFEEAL